MSIGESSVKSSLVLITTVTPTINTETTTRGDAEPNWAERQLEI
jgi:hypothetical protein